MIPVIIEILMGGGGLHRFIQHVGMQDLIVYQCFADFPDLVFYLGFLHPFFLGRFIPDLVFTPGNFLWQQGLKGFALNIFGPAVVNLHFRWQTE